MAKDPYVKVVWEGPDVYMPRAGGIVTAGDEVYVTAEQADDPATPCSRVKTTSRKTSGSSKED